jgi:hypothetical protein
MLLRAKWKRRKAKKMLESRREGRRKCHSATEEKGLRQEERVGKERLIADIN